MVRASEPSIPADADGETRLAFECVVPLKKRRSERVLLRAHRTGQGSVSSCSCRSVFAPRATVYFCAMFLPEGHGQVMTST
jgi:hypothetical protein